MTAYTAIGDGELIVDRPITESLLTRLRDNPIAISEGSAGAPKVQSDGLEPNGDGTLYLLSAPTGGSEPQTAVKKIMEFRVQRAGTVTCRTEGLRPPGIPDANLQVYKNAVEYGPNNDLPGNNTVYEFADSLFFEAGDRIQLYVESTGTGDVDWKFSVTGEGTDCQFQSKENYADFPGDL